MFQFFIGALAGPRPTFAFFRIGGQTFNGLLDHQQLIEVKVANIYHPSCFARVAYAGIWIDKDLV